MTNDLTLDGRYLGQLSADFVKVADSLKEAAYLIHQQEEYAYPVFLMAATPLSVGALLIDKGAMGNQWYYYAAYLEALVQYNLVAEDKVAAFKHAYKDPEEFCCLLVVDTAFTRFVYMPYPVD